MQCLKGVTDSYDIKVQDSRKKIEESGETSGKLVLVNICKLCMAVRNLIISWQLMLTCERISNVIIIMRNE